ncbi:hypothetical protein SO802_026436 [Lithocarpus litseifolius]|uniref:RNase H type-1 domain-containing protein n=1 Tax=Lithocarpus litseifolius TaxID=425828 RepID=A0AAW2C1D0_9ROSI
MTVWGIWHQRNQVRLLIPYCTSDQLTPQAKEKLDDFLATLPPKLPVMLRPRLAWKLPKPSMFKINFDGAVSKNENKSSIGVVIRDHQGLVIASLAQQLPYVFQPLEIEAIVAARALEFGVETGIAKAVLEGDSELIIKVLKAGGHTIASVELLIQVALLLSGLYSKLLYSLIAEEMEINSIF